MQNKKCEQMVEIINEHYHYATDCKFTQCNQTVECNYSVALNTG